MRPTVSAGKKGHTWATFNIRNPPILQNRNEYGCDHLQVNCIQYTIKEAPHHGDDDTHHREEGVQGEFFNQQYDSTIQQERTVKKLKPGTKYILTLKADYNTSPGDSIVSKDIEFHTLPLTGIFQSSWCIQLHLEYH